MRSDTSVSQLVPKRRINKETGHPEVDYYWNGQLAPKVRIIGTLVRQLGGYSLIKKDLENASRWLQRAYDLVRQDGQDPNEGYHIIADRESGDLIKAYFVAAVTFYGKCFTKAPGRRVSVSPDWLDKNHRSLHDYYMRYRHSFAAHSGDDRFEDTYTYVLLNPSMTRLLPYLPTIRVQPDVAMPPSGEKGLIELIDYVGEIVERKYDKVAEKIIMEHIMTNQFEFWLEMTQLESPVSYLLPEKKKKSQRGN